MNDRYEPLSPDTPTEEMLTTPRPVVASPSIVQRPKDCSRVLARVPEVGCRKSPPKSEPAIVDEMVQPLSPVRRGFSRWFLVGIAASLLLLTVVPLVLFNNSGPEYSMPEQPAPNAPPAPAWNSTPSPIDSQRQVSEPQTRIVDSSLPNNSRPTWRNPSSTPSSWQSPQPIVQNSRPANRYPALPSVQNRPSNATRYNAPQQNRYDNRYPPVTPPQHDTSTQQRHQMANRPSQANAMRQMSISSHTQQQNNRSAYRYQPGSTNTNYRVPPMARVEGTSVLEPGVASFKGVIEKPTIRTMNDRARPSLY